MKPLTGQKFQVKSGVFRSSHVAADKSVRTQGPNGARIFPLELIGCAAMLFDPLNFLKIV